MNQTSLPGNSSATIELIQESKYGPVIKKTCAGNAADRLLIQAKKQANFECSNKIRTPRIYEIESSPGLTSVLMEYVRGSDFVLYTNTASPEEFKSSISIIVDLIKKGFSTGSVSEFPTSMWTSKVNDVIDACQRRHIIEEHESHKLRNFLLNSLPQKIIIGNCHGDLTFSNVIVESPDRLCIFDFLNPTFDTPYEDAAKFLQDAQFSWSTLKHTGNFDRTRVLMYWKHAEKIFRDELGGMYDHELLRKFQVLGLIRVLPYTFEDRIIQIVRNLVLKEVNRDSCPPMRR
jgi:tRNA A-37 threonylcarbamoyl transferase component Bud32